MVLYRLVSLGRSGQAIHVAYRLVFRKNSRSTGSMGTNLQYVSGQEGLPFSTVHLNLLLRNVVKRSPATMKIFKRSLSSKRSEEQIRSKLESTTVSVTAFQTGLRKSVH